MPEVRTALTGRPANDEMVKGYMDGLDLDAPEPSDNRSHSYRHGFANARDDRRHKPRASFAELNRMADLAMAKDELLKHGQDAANAEPQP